MLALTLAAPGCAGGGGGKTNRAAGSPATRTAPARSFLERLIPPPGGNLPGTGVHAQITRLVTALPVERKVAQLLLVGFVGRDPTAPFFRTLKGMDLGGVAIGRRDYTGPAGLKARFTEAIRNAAAGSAHQAPFVVAQQQGGDLTAFPDLPPRAAAADLGGIANAAAEARRTAITLKRLGLNGILAPGADVGVGTGGSDALGPDAFSDQTKSVSAYAAAVVAAYRRAGMLSAPSHFPGIGAAADLTSAGPTEVGLAMPALEKRDIPPFRAAIRAGAQAIVVGHASYAPDSFVVPASLSHEIETNLLRGGLGFRGVAITDDLEAGAIVAGNAIPAAAVQAIQAGADMVWISGPDADWLAAYRALLAAVKTRRISPVRLNAAVTRIITAKRELGLRNRRKPTPVPTATPGATPQPKPQHPNRGERSDRHRWSLGRAGRGSGGWRRRRFGAPTMLGGVANLRRATGPRPATAPQP